MRLSERQLQLESKTRKKRRKKKESENLENLRNWTRRQNKKYLKKRRLKLRKNEVN